MDKILHHQGWTLSHYFQGFNHPRWCRISSINSINDVTWKNISQDVGTASMARLASSPDNRVQQQVALQLRLLDASSQQEKSRTTPVKIKMKPKNHPIEMENHLPNLHVGVPCWFSRVNRNTSIWFVCCWLQLPLPPQFFSYKPTCWSPFPLFQNLCRWVGGSLFWYRWGFSKTVVFHVGKKMPVM